MASGSGLRFEAAHGYFGISNQIKVFKVSNDASFQKKYLFIKQFFDWMSTNGLGGRSEAKNLTSSFMDGF